MREREKAASQSQLEEAERTLEACESDVARWRAAEEAARRRAAALEKASSATQAAQQRRRERVVQARCFAREECTARQLLRLWSQLVCVKSQWMRGVAALRGRAERTHVRLVMRRWSTLAQWWARGGAELRARTSNGVRHGRLRFFVRAWRGVAHKSRQISRAIHRAHRIRRRTLMWQTMSALGRLKAEAAQKAKAARALSKRRRACDLSWHFGAWSLAVTRSRRLLAAGNRLEKATFARLMSCVLAHWCLFTRMSRRCLRIELTRQRKQTAHVLQLWGDTAAELAGRCRLLKRILGNRCTKYARQGFDSWSLFAARRRTRQAAYTKAARRMRAVVAGSLHAWSVNVKKQRRRARIGRRVGVKLMVCMFERWRLEAHSCMQNAAMQKEWDKEKEGLVCERDKLREGLASLQDALKISTSVNRSVSCVPI